MRKRISIALVILVGVIALLAGAYFLIPALVEPQTQPSANSPTETPSSSSNPSSGTTPHVHEYTKNTVAATCSTQGYTVHVCLCGDTYVDSYTDMIDHSFEQATVDATCTQGGYILYCCSGCNTQHIESESAPLGHDWDSWITSNYATTEGPGERVRTCLTCGDLEAEIIPALPDENHQHEYTTEEIYPTCTGNGYLSHTCVSCGDTYIDSDVPPLGHQFSEWETHEEATCANSGFRTRICEHCSLEEEAEIPKVPCYLTLTYATTLVDLNIRSGPDSSYEKIGHIAKGKSVLVLEQATIPSGAIWGRIDEGWIRLDQYTELTNKFSALTDTYLSETFPATCTSDGYTRNRCQLCAFSFLDIIPSTGHSFGEWYAEGENCGDNARNVRTCTFCGELNYMAAKNRHAFSAWTIESEASCTTSGVKHRFCLFCNKEETVISEATGHLWGSWKISRDPSESSEGLEWRECRLCNAMDYISIPIGGTPHTHSYVATEVAPTCADFGYTLKTCSTCGYFYKTEYTSYLTHNWSDWVVTRQNSVETIGYKQRECSRCGEIESLGIPMLNPETGLPYVSYVDSNVTEHKVTGYKSSVDYQYKTLIVYDYRTWASYINVCINQDDGLDISYFQNDGTLITLRIRQVSVRDNKGCFGTKTCCVVRLNYDGTIDVEVLDNHALGATNCSKCSYPYWYYATWDEIGCMRTEIACQCPVCYEEIVPEKCHHCVHKGFEDYSVPEIVTILSPTPSPTTTNFPTGWSSYMSSELHIEDKKRYAIC